MSLEPVSNIPRRVQSLINIRIMKNKLCPSDWVITLPVLIVEWKSRDCEIVISLGWLPSLPMGSWANCSVSGLISISLKFPNCFTKFLFIISFAMLLSWSLSSGTEEEKIGGVCWGCGEGVSYH